MKYQKLFTPGKIGSLELKNRIVMSAMGVSFAKSTGEASDDMIAYYEERAKNGCGLIITEITRIDDVNGVGTNCQLSLTDAKHIPQMERLVMAVHKHGAKLFPQLHHPGRQTHARLMQGRPPVAPSPIPCGKCKEMPHELTTKECEDIRSAFVKGAVLAQMAGCDGVELHAAHGYLLNQFLSPHTNKRTDKYGGCFSNRMRIMAEIITAIKHMCGREFPISVRISADEFIDGGNALEDSVKIARTLESYGVDAINVSSGTYESGITIIEPNSYPQGWKKHLAATIRKNVKIPVIAVNCIKEPGMAEQLLEEGVCDFTALGRAHLADAAWVKKAKAGDDIAIRKCLGCMYCFGELESGRKCKCAINATLSREREFANWNYNGDERTAVVVGGGPAGMEAARVLAQRKFNVVLFEKTSVLGGQLNAASKPPHKEKIGWLVETMAEELRRLNVDIRLNTEATVEIVKPLGPAVVFVAAGAAPIIPQIPGVDRANVITAEEYLQNGADVGKSVAVIGSGLTGCETAEDLAGKGHKVTLVEMLKKVGPGVNETVLYDVMSRFNKGDTAILTSHRLMDITDQGVVLLDMKATATTVLPVDTVVLAMGVRPRCNVAQPFIDTFDDVILIGDNVKGGRIAEAISDGFSRAFSF